MLSLFADQRTCPDGVYDFMCVDTDVYSIPISTASRGGGHLAHICCTGILVLLAFLRQVG